MMRAEARLTNQNPRKFDLLISLYIPDAYIEMCMALISVDSCQSSKRGYLLRSTLNDCCRDETHECGV
jgi:hypothetical protein